MRSSRGALRLVLAILFVLLVVAGYFILRWLVARRVVSELTRASQVWAWVRDPAAQPELAIQAGERCGEAPFLYPTSGIIGFIWGDSFRPGHRHQGLDIFGAQGVGTTPVVAAFSGYLTRLPEWKSSLIIRIPQDPLLPDRQIWTYYTHMADRQGNSYIEPGFPPGSHEMYVEAGTLLGYQGNFSGDPDNPTGVHLHFSVVEDDGQGSFRNELEIRNTLDPSPYFGMPLNADTNPGDIPVCPD